ncbi:methyltransferase domain-containing protein [Amycolatopsis sp. NBC_01480]|uniref:methyltransferase domain-containing protein n=1 Tax=Amycolatopsis sp. NBC_01480 TaxID=2903562 RepID=UPI002E28FAE9|nr:methyltransferase domain-containing protein [Amycolatopsis sp. NBC_01480]
MTETASTAWDGHARALAELLAERGDIRSPEWRAAVAEVPRHVFVPIAYTQNSRGEWEPWSTEGAWERVYAPTTLVTALADRDGWREPISSTTNPELMVRMLEALDIRDGHRVLEIGTGTGYNAGLLSHRLGDHNVASVDIGSEFVTAARDRLAGIGYHPTLKTVDGESGLPGHAPYDRIIATCSVPAVPWAWAEQVTPDGSILVDVRPSIAAGNLVLLQRRGDRLVGRFSARRGSFMAMRHATDAAPGNSPAETLDPGGHRRTDAPLTPWDSTPVVWFLAQFAGLPRDVVCGWELDSDTRARTASTLTSPDGSSVRVDLAEHTVSGTLALWAPVEQAYREWIEAGQPGWDRLGMTVTASRQQVWLDSPDSAWSWELPV